MKKIILYSISVLCLVLIALPGISKANGFNLSQDCKNGGSSSAICSTQNTNSSNNPVSLKIADIVNILIEVAGVLAVIMIIISGIRYAWAAGDSNKVNSAKNGIIFSLIGLAVIVVAKIIINVVISNIK